MPEGSYLYPEPQKARESVTGGVAYATHERETNGANAENEGAITAARVAESAAGSGVSA